MFKDFMSKKSLLFVAADFFLNACIFAAESYKIDVLARLGPVKARKQLKPENPAPKTAKVVGWTDTLDYGPVEELQKSLKAGAYAS